jgi:flagellar M-ring protein FliF
MLNKVLGENNSIVRVSASLNFEKITRTSEKVDPDNFAIVSEERNEETTTNTDTTLHKRENAITNYELNKVVEHFQNSVGDIKQLSVAVFVNSPDTSRGTPARGPAEIQKISDIVKNAVGFSAEREDQISVEEFTFDRSLLERENEMMASIEERETLMDYMKIGFGVVAVIALLVLLRTLMKKLGLDEYMKHQRDLLLQEAEASLEVAAEKAELSELERQKRLAEESKARLAQQERVSQEVREFSSDTERTTRILRYWLVDDDDQEY